MISRKCRLKKEKRVKKNTRNAAANVVQKKRHDPWLDHQTGSPVRSRPKRSVKNGSYIKKKKHVESEFISCLQLRTAFDCIKWGRKIYGTGEQVLDAAYVKDRGQARKKGHTDYATRRFRLEKKCGGPFGLPETRRAKTEA